LKKILDLITMISRLYVLLLCVLLPSITHGFYDEEDHVVELDQDNFEALVTSSDDIWLVEFYAPWCGHCKTMAPEWKKAAKVLRGLSYIGAVDATANESLASKYGVKSYPTIKVFRKGEKPSTFEGARTAAAIGSAALKEMRGVVKSRLGIKSKKGKKSVPDKVVKLSDSTFDAQVLNSEEFWMVEFYAPWCGHCKNLAPEWKKAAARLDGLAKFGAVDATVEKALAAKYEIHGYPTIKYFPLGEKMDGIAYTGGRTADDLINFAAEKGEFSVPPEAEDTFEAGEVIPLTDSNFDQLVLNGKDVWFLEFFAPWCGHCKNLEPAWKGAARRMKSKAKFGAIDATVNTKLAEEYKVEGYPTLFSVVNGHVKPFETGRAVEEIVRSAQMVLDGPLQPEGPSQVVELSAETFDEEVMDSKDFWIVDFYAPWCSHCKKMHPEFVEASNMLEGEVKLGMVDCTAGDNQSLQTKFNITGFPTVLFFMADKEIPPEDYTGTRTAVSIKEHALETKSEYLSPPSPVLQLTSTAVFEHQCKETLCLLAFLPHILDTGAKGREDYLQVLKDQATIFKKKKYGYLWAEGMTQQKLEETFNVGGSGYPALVVYNHKKSRYVSFFGGFNSDAITDFVDRIHSGGERTQALRSEVSIDEIQPWDGKDGELPHEDL